MTLTIAYNGAKKGIELFFKGEVPKELATFLRELGFKETLATIKMWYADNHPAYQNFATSLKEVLAKGEAWNTAIVQPSFAPSLKNIDTNKFSIVTIYYREEEHTKSQDYVLFDSYKKVVQKIATQFAIATYGENFKHLEAFPRNYKVKARALFKEEHIIYGTPPLRDSTKKEPLPVKKEEETVIEKIEEKVTQQTAIDNQVTDIEVTQEVAAENDTTEIEETETSKLRITLNEVISELLTLEEKLKGESETIIGTTLFDLEAAAEEQNETTFKHQLLKFIQLFKDWVDDLDPTFRTTAVTSINKLIHLLEEEKIPEEKQKRKGKAISKDIYSRDHTVKNVLVPNKAGEPFQSGNLYLSDASFIKKKYPELYTITNENLLEISGLAMFRLSQMAHPTDYGIDVHRSNILQEWEHRGPEAFKEIGFPTDLNYPYVNIHIGYKSVAPLATQIDANEDKHKWWAAVEHSRPIADLAKGIVIIDALLIEQVERRLELINPKTKKPKTDKKSKEAYNDIEWKINQLERSKLVIQDYMNKDLETENSPPEPKPQKEKKQNKNDYLDKVIAIMHTAFAKAERLSKKKIEQLKEKTGAPTLGALWEAVELSWLLWYKMLYKEPIPFEARLKKIIHFWNTIQPTYAYSDSSKELYKQYSTPCPIGAIVAQYTKMDQAEFIFEPSAGNGLLLVGAQPRITHVNEIDKSRIQSLKHQGFGSITSHNAAQPFSEMMCKVHDVVVTNPPFASWKESQFDKERIIQKYFNKHRGLASHIRLEHLMAGLALYTMTDTGKAAIIIMGHVYYGDDGLLAKYRPFFNWLYRHYKVDDVINMNSYKLYNKQGAVTRTMLILIGGRKITPSGVSPNKSEQPHLENIVETFEDLWKRVQKHTHPNIDTIIKQLKTAHTQ